MGTLQYETYYWRTGPRTCGVALVTAEHKVQFHTCGVNMHEPMIDRYLREVVAVGDPHEHVITSPADCEDLMISILRAKAEGKFEEWRT